jgi:hypothetical protein
MRNFNGKVLIPRAKRSYTWKYFDSLPKEVKEVIQNAPYKIQIKNVRERVRRLGVAEFVRQTQKQIDDYTKKSCAATYGPDHPQSR